MNTKEKHPVFTTDRLTLRPWQQEDAPWLYSLAQDPEIGPLCGWKPHESEQESRQVIDILRQPGTWCVTLRDTGEILGAISLFGQSRWLRNDGSRERELGFWIGRRYWRKGYIPEAAEVLLEEAFRQGTDRVWCGHLDFNRNSARVQEKLGFQYVLTCPGTNSFYPAARDVVNVLTNKQWERRKQPA